MIINEVPEKEISEMFPAGSAIDPFRLFEMKKGHDVVLLKVISRFDDDGKERDIKDRISFAEWRNFRRDIRAIEADNLFIDETISFIENGGLKRK